MNFKKFLMTALATGSLLSVMAVSAFAEGSGAGAGTDGGMNIISLLFIPLVLVLMYFMLIRPQKKREKETAQMRNALEIGDEIVTIGGIIGRVVNIKDDDIITIETGSDKTKVKIRKWAIQERITVKDE